MFLTSTAAYINAHITDIVIGGGIIVAAIFGLRYGRGRDDSQ